MSRSGAVAQRLERELVAIYAEIPNVPCTGACTNACGPIGLAAIEKRRMLRAAPGTPDHDSARPLTCPLLTADGRCSVYGVRPLVCRLFGATEQLRCLWGCVPERWLTQEEAKALWDRVEALSAEHVAFGVPGGEAGLVAVKTAHALLNDPAIREWCQAGDTPAEVQRRTREVGFRLVQQQTGGQ